MVISSRNFHVANNTQSCWVAGRVKTARGTAPAISCKQVLYSPGLPALASPDFRHKKTANFRGAVLPASWSFHAPKTIVKLVASFCQAGKHHGLTRPSSRRHTAHQARRSSEALSQRSMARLMGDVRRSHKMAITL